MCATPSSKLISTSINRGISYPYSITFFENKLYWSEWDQRSIQMYDMSSDKDPRTLVRGAPSTFAPMGVLVLDAKRQPMGKNPCEANNGGCSHLCLLSPNPPGFTCACPTGVKQTSKFNCANGETLIL